MNELKLEQKCRDMMLYGYTALRQYPKYEKHVLAAETRHTMLRLLRLIVTAAKRYHKKTTLTELDIELAVLRSQVRLAFELKHLDSRRYELWFRHLAEMGRMIGGWLAQARQ